MNGGAWILEATDAIHVGGRISVRWVGKVFCIYHDADKCSCCRDTLIRSKWHQESHSVCMRRDFIAIYAAGQTAPRKYIDYKHIEKEKEGAAEGTVEFVAPSKPGPYFARYLRADYTEMAVSATIVVRSALSVLLEEVKCEGMRGNAETVLEMFETVMLSLKPNDDAFHKQALESWRGLQDKKLRPPDTAEEPTDAAAVAAADPATHSHDIGVVAGAEAGCMAGANEIEGPSKEATQGDGGGEATGGQEPAVGATGVLLRLRVRGSGYYAQKKGVSGADGDARLVACGGRVLVEGDASTAKGAAGLHLLVLGLADLSIIFSQCYDTHHDTGAAERLAADMSQRALDNPCVDPARVLVIVTSQYAWEGYFNSPLLCERLGRCGANLDRLLAIQKNCSSWISSTYSTPYVLVGIPGRRSGLRFSAERLGASGKKQAAETEVVLVRPPPHDSAVDSSSSICGSAGGSSSHRETDWSPVALRAGSQGSWMLALPDPPAAAPAGAEGPCGAGARNTSGRGAPAASAALGELSTNALRFLPGVSSSRHGDVAKGSPSSTAACARGARGLGKNDDSLEEGSGLGAATRAHERLLRCALLAVAHGKLHSLGRHPLEAGQLRPLAALVTLRPHDLEIAASFACVAAAIGDVGGARETLLDEALGALIQIYSLPPEGDDVAKVHAASLDAARCLCGIVNDASLSLRQEVVGLYSLKGPRTEVQRCVILRLSALSRNPDMVMRIVSGPALKVLAMAVVPPSQSLPSTPQPRRVECSGKVGSPHWGSSSTDRMTEDADDAALRCDALLGLASLCAVKEMRVELLRLQILGPVISALACGENFIDNSGVHGNVPKQDGFKRPEDSRGEKTGKEASHSGDDDTVASSAAGNTAPISLSHDEPHQNALAIVKELAQVSVRLSYLSFDLQSNARLDPAASPPIDFESIPEGVAGGACQGDQAPAEVEGVFAVVVAGWWCGSVCGPMVIVGPAALERSVAGGASGASYGGWGAGDVVVLSAPQASREAAVAAVRACQAGGAAAVILHVGSVPAPFPLLEHLPRDYGDLMIPILVLPKDDVVRLQHQSDALCATSRGTATSITATALPTANGKPPLDASLPLADAHASSSAIVPSGGSLAKDTRGGTRCSGGAQSGAPVLSKAGSGSSGGLKELLLAASGATSAVVAASAAATNVATGAAAAAATSVAARATDESAARPGGAASSGAAAALPDHATSHVTKRETHPTNSSTSAEVADVHASPAIVAASGAEAAAVARPLLQLMCSVGPPQDCRREMIARAVPLLRRMYEAASQGGNTGGGREGEQAASRRPSASKAMEGGGGSDGGNSGGRVGEDELERRQAAWRQKNNRHQVAHVIRLLGGSTTLSRTVSSHGVRILSMDGGGIRGLVMVELLRKLEVDTGRRITELFDVICGTSAGGLLAMALLLGRSLVEIEEQFWRISTLVFRKGWFTTAQQLTYTGSKYDARVLEDLFRDQYGSGQLLDSPQRPYCFMVSTLASVVPAQPFIWRNYSYPCDHHSRYPGTCNASLITALRATSAAPSYFDDIVHEHGRHLDGGCIANNPTAIAIHEARCLFPGREVNCVVSLATGAPPISANANAGVGWQGVFSTVIHSASSVNRVADCLCDTLAEGSYFRFSPEGAPFAVEIDQTDKAKIEDLQSATHEYIEQQERNFAALAQRLRLD